MNTDTSVIVTAVLIYAVVGLGLYVWTALALAAVFRKSGEEQWKAWVPILNEIVLLQLAGMSGWLVLLNLLQPAGWIVRIVACHTIGRAFGFGAGMTVLAALLLPVWASIIGFGSARWVGVEHGPRRSAPVDETSGPAMRAAREVAATPRPAGAPGPESSVTPPPAYGGAPAARPATPEVAPPAGGWAPPPLPGAAPATAASAFAPAPAPAAPAPASAFAPTPVAASTAGAPGVDRSPLGDTGEVTGAVTGAPAPISAVPFSAAPAAPTSPLTRTPAAVPVVPPIDDEDPEVTGPGHAERHVEPWAPARSPESDAFPESSGPVSAVAEVPGVGGPMSALSSVSAQTPGNKIPDDPFEETIIARRKRTEWSLVPPTGEPIAIAAEVALVGRRPALDPAFPGAQLISIDDGTVSKTHARLELRGDVWFITDLDSTNGILFATVLGTEVEATPGEAIEAGDRFLLGDAEVRLIRSDS